MTTTTYCGPCRDGAWCPTHPDAHADDLAAARGCIIGVGLGLLLLAVAVIVALVTT